MDVVNGSKEGARLQMGRTPRGLLLRSGREGDGGLSRAAAVGVGRKRWL